MGWFVIGVDFGTESGRAVVVDLRDGRVIGDASMEYPHAVMDERFLDGSRLPAEFALHHPQDYLDVLVAVVPAAMARAGINGAEVVGLGIDTTSCTVLPTLDDGTPLAFVAPFRTNPHAYAKVWKHHAAQPQARHFTAVCEEQDPELLSEYGGVISSEWLVPKALEIFEKDRAVFDAAHRIIEVQDWLVWQLTGNELRNSGAAGYKACYRWERGSYASPELLEATAEGFSALMPKLDADLAHPGTRAGYLAEEWADRLGLHGRVAVPVGNMDAHGAVVAAGLTGPGPMLLVMGTSVCNMLMGEDKAPVPGISGAVFSGMLPDLWGYEAGQAGVGDVLNWYVRNMAPHAVHVEASARGVSPHQVLIEQIMTDGSGADRPDLLALEWINGNRSVLVDADLSGLLLGLTMGTRAHDIYRTLIEAACFGQQIIIETFERHGIPITEIIACGGLASKNPVLMQTLADVTARDVKVTRIENLSALGAALHASVAAGSTAGGFDSLAEAAELGGGIATTYHPRPEAKPRIDHLMSIYRDLHQHFGVDHSTVMHGLKAKNYL